MPTQFRIEPFRIQQILPASANARFEGLGYSSSGAVLAAATADTNETLLFRRGTDGRFESAPYCTLAGLQYPHDVSFGSGPLDGTIAIAQRAGAVSLFQRQSDATYGPRPTFEISGPDSKLEFSDAVSFVPPNDDYLAACNLSANMISFYRLLSHSPVRFGTKPEFEMTHERIDQPDGLAFSKDGEWLATANHGGGSVTLFQRRSSGSNGGPLYGPDPAAEIRDADLHYPHSVAFTNEGHLVVTNAGANYLNVYRLTDRRFTKSLSIEPVFKLRVNIDSAFRAVNSDNKMEGGPKGLAVHGSELAVCSPEFGIKIYAFREHTFFGKLAYHLGF